MQATYILQCIYGKWNMEYFKTHKKLAKLDDINILIIKNSLLIFLINSMALQYSE